jgi:hypothetical protein
LSKYKYQYELVKELSDEKDKKMKIVEKELIKLNEELEELKSNNWG